MKKEYSFILLLLVISIIVFIFNKSSYAIDDKLTLEEEIELQRNAVVEVTKAFLRKGSNIQYDTNRRRFNFTPEEATKDNTIYSVCSVFVQAVYTEALGINVPNYTQFLHDYAADDENNEFVVMYYTEEEYINKKNNDGKDAIFKEILKKVKPGDILTNKGHTMLFVSVSSDDAQLIESVGSSGAGEYEVNGSIREISLSKLASNGTIYKNGEFSIIRPISNGKTFRDRNGNVSNYKITDSSLTRISYPDIDIEKLGSKNTNSYVNFNDEITYTIKITNNSDKVYNDLNVVEEVSNMVEIIDDGGGNYSNGKITWNDIAIEAGKSLNIEYTVRVKKMPSNYKKIIKSVGYVGNIKNTEVINTIGYILNKNDSEKLINTINSIKDSSSKNGLDFVEEVYNKAFNIELKLLKNEFITDIELGTLNKKLDNYVFLDLYNSYSNANWFRTSRVWRDGTARKASLPFDVDYWNGDYDKYIKNIHQNSLKVGDLVLYSLNDVLTIYLCIGETKFLEISDFSKKIIDDEETIVNIFSEIFYKDYFVTLSPSLLLQNNLANIKVNNKDIDDFAIDRLDYSLNVDDTVDEVQIKATSIDLNVSFVSGDVGVKKLVTGNNIFKIKSTNSGGGVKEYTLNVIKKERGKSSNNYLSELNLNVGNISFDKNTTNYDVTVSYDIDEIVIDAIPEDDKAVVLIPENKKLNVGINEFIVRVTAEDLGVKEYKIIVLRKEKGDDNIQNNNNSSNSQNNNDNDVIVNPQTGKSVIYISLTVIIFLSLSLVIYYKKKI